jgi:hypothetical protein
MYSYTVFSPCTRTTFPMRTYAFPATKKELVELVREARGRGFRHAGDWDVYETNDATGATTHVMRKTYKHEFKEAGR